jgi:hypothetical protein
VDRRPPPGNSKIHLDADRTPLDTTDTAHGTTVAFVLLSIPPGNLNPAMMEPSRQTDRTMPRGSTVGRGLELENNYPLIAGVR